MIVKKKPLVFTKGEKPDTKKTDNAKKPFSKKKPGKGVSAVASKAAKALVEHQSNSTSDDVVKTKGKKGFTKLAKKK